MKKPTLISFTMLCLLSTILLVYLTSNIQPVEAEPKTWTVDDDGPADFNTIQEAINAASDEDIIFVYNGTYCENVVVNKEISLVGENREGAIVDGNGIGTVIRISADNVTIANLSIRNGGHSLSWLDSCIYGNYLSNILIENNTIMNATNGIIFYGFSNSKMRHNVAEEFGLMGLHLDGGSTNCTVADNIVINSLEGIELERSAGNWIEGNKFISNKVSIVLNECTGPNVLKKNNMTSDWHNLIVWGSTLEAFNQDVDTSNNASNKTVYYITNSNSLLVDPSGYPNLGYLAVVNCTNITIRDADLSFNGDGLLMAQSTNCSLANLTIGGNNGTLLHGGLTLFKSNDNVMVNSRISNNSVGICLYQSYGNHFYHNSFVGNDKPVISNFYSPFSQPSGSHSVARWDNDFEGNYWSNYAGIDSDHDGVGDTIHAISENNQDNYPLMGTFTEFNATSEHHVQAICNSTISDFRFNGTAIGFYVMGEDGTTGFCRICIPTALIHDTFRVFVNGTEILPSPEPLPFSNSTHNYLYFTYNHSTQEVVIIPEVPSFPILPLLVILPLFIISTLLAVILYRRKHSMYACE